MLTWLTLKLGKNGLFYAIVIVTVAVLLLLVKCSNDRTPAKQVEQSVASAQAVNEAAAEAVQIIDDRRVTDADVEKVVGLVTGEIENAQTVDDIRNAVIDRLCEQASHSDDPACQLR